MSDTKTIRMESEFPQELYRPNVGIVLLNAKDEVFVAQRIDAPGPAWQMPQGGIDEGEDIIQAALRELEEETSVTTVRVEKIVPQDEKAWFVYDLPADLQKKICGGKFLGQCQKWVVMRFSGDDQVVNLATEHPEFSAWKWASVSDLESLAVPFKRDIYRVLSDLVL